MNKGKAVLSVFLAVMFGLLLLIAWREMVEAEPRQARVIAILKTNDVRKEFWQTVAHGMQTAEKEFDVILDVRGPLSETDAEEQTALLREAIAEKPDAIVLAPADPEFLVPAAQEVMRAGIRLVVIDMALHAEIGDTLVLTDHIDAGRKAGAALARQLKPNAKIAIVSSLENYRVSLLREQGVREALEAEFPHIEITGTYFNHADEGTYATTKVIFSEHRDLAGIVVLDGLAAVGVSEALKDIEAARNVKLVGFDGSIHEIKLLEEGVMTAAVVRKPFNMGYLGVKAGVDLIRGQKPPPVVAIDSVVITQDNMYEPENQKILFPFVIR